MTRAVSVENPNSNVTMTSRAKAVTENPSVAMKINPSKHVKVIGIV